MMFANDFTIHPTAYLAVLCMAFLIAAVVAVTQE